MSEVKGLIVGKFAPPHLGHINLIERALDKCDELLVLLTFDKRWVEEQDKRIQIQLSLTNRFYSLDAVCKRIAKEKDKKIICANVDESHINYVDNTYVKFCELCETKFDELDFYPDVMFSVKTNTVKDYTNQKCWPKKDLVLLDKEVNVTSAEIRQKMIEKVETDEWLRKWCLV